MNVQENGVKLIFLAVEKFEDNVITRGAFLLTDTETKPLEFRCTTPIRPTNLQKMLYGGVLDKHIKVDLIGLPLMKSIKDNNTVILVRDKMLLEMRPNLDIPVVALSRDDEIDVSIESDRKPEGNNCLLSSEAGKFESIIVSVHKDYINEREEWRAKLSEVFKGHDLLEPFSRIGSALNQINKEDKK